MSCGSCYHFAASPVSAQLPPHGEGKPIIGACRRFPPRIVPTRNDTLEALFPSVHRDQECGEYSCVVPLC